MTSTMFNMQSFEERVETIATQYPKGMDTNDPAAEAYANGRLLHILPCEAFPKGLAGALESETNTHYHAIFRVTNGPNTWHEGKFNWFIRFPIAKTHANSVQIFNDN